MMGKVGLILLLVLVVLCLALYLSCCRLFQVGSSASYQQKRSKMKKKREAKPKPPTPEKALFLTTDAWRSQQSFELVSISSRDHLRLTGYYLACPGAKRTVLLVHGWRGSWERHMSLFGPFLQSQKCNLLFVEQRGHGGSQGKYMGFGVLERYDCLAWIHYLQQRDPDGVPIYLLGCSQGATTVLMTAGFPLPEQVHGIIADCGFLSPEEQVATTLKAWFHLPKQPFLFVADRICRHRAGYSYQEYSTLEAMKVNRIPVLFVHGKEDRFVPVSNTIRNYEACQAEKELLLVDGARHLQSYAFGTEQYQEKLQSMFRKYDRAAEREVVQR